MPLRTKPCFIFALILDHSLSPDNTYTTILGRRILDPRGILLHDFRSFDHAGYLAAAAIHQTRTRRLTANVASFFRDRCYHPAHKSGFFVKAFAPLVPTPSTPYKL